MLTSVLLLSSLLIAASCLAAGTFHPGPSKSLKEQPGFYYLPITNGEIKPQASLVTVSGLTEEAAQGLEWTCHRIWGHLNSPVSLTILLARRESSPELVRGSSVQLRSGLNF